MTIAKKQDRKNSIFNKVMRDSSLRFRIIAVLLIVSLFPLFFVGIGSWTVFGRLLEKKSLELQQTVVESHADAIESYLSERLNSLKIIAATHSFQDIIKPNIYKYLLLLAPHHQTILDDKRNENVVEYYLIIILSILNL